MSTSKRKRNEYLETNSSDGDDSPSYDSGAADDSRTTQHHRLKYQKSSTPASSDDDGHVFQSDSEPIKSRASLNQGKRQQLAPTSISPDNHGSNSKAQPTKSLSTTPQTSPPATRSGSPNLTSSHHTKKPSKSNPSKHLSTTARPAHKTGVIYLSRIPPFMKPPTLRRLLSPHGTILRIFLTPEPHSTYLKRRSLGGNKKRSFIDGWVEFSRRKDAKICAEAINATTMGGRGWYGEDVWNVRYLKGFRWDDLMAGVRQEEREREEKIRVGLRREGRERAEFLKGVQRAKIEETRRGKKMKKVRDEDDQIEDGDAEEEGQGKTKGGGFLMRFRQNEKKGSSGKPVVQQSEDVKRVLSKIF